MMSEITMVSNHDVIVALCSALAAGIAIGFLVAYQWLYPPKGHTEEPVKEIGYIPQTFQGGKDKRS